MPPADRPDYYRVMGISRTASAEDIKSEYRSLARKRHPDAGGTNHEFTALQEAYEVLSDPTRRAEYDRFLLDLAKGAAKGKEASVFDLRPRHEEVFSPEPTPSPAPTGPRPSRKELDELVKRGARHEADAMARRWITQGHDAGYANYVLGVLKMKEGQPDEACSRFSMALQHEPKNEMYAALFEKSAKQGGGATAAAPRKLGCLGAVVALCTFVSILLWILVPGPLSNR